jgi:hypothetical protein
MRTIQPVAKYSPSRTTDLVRNGVEFPPNVFTRFAANSPIYPPATHLERQRRVMNGYFARKSEAQMLKETRSRAAEFYFNGTCLVHAVLSLRFRKIPFFLRHLWCALA